MFMYIVPYPIHPTPTLFYTIFNILGKEMIFSQVPEDERGAWLM